MADNEKKQRTIVKRQKPLKRRFLELLANGGNIEIACRKAGTSRKTLYRWLEKDPRFAQLVAQAKQQGREVKCDIAEAGLVGLAANKNLGAIKFLLQNQHPEYMPPTRYKEHPRERPPVLDFVIPQDLQTLEDRQRAIGRKYEEELRNLIVESTDARKNLPRP